MTFVVRHWTPPSHTRIAQNTIRLEYSRKIALQSNTEFNRGHSGEYGNGAKLVGKMSKSVMQLISIHLRNLFLVSDNENSQEQALNAILTFPFI